jgi:hypothetical protein
LVLVVLAFLPLPQTVEQILFSLGSLRQLAVVLVATLILMQPLQAVLVVDRAVIKLGALPQAHQGKVLLVVQVIYMVQVAAGELVQLVAMVHL